MEDIYTAEIEVWDPVEEETYTLYVATVGFTSLKTDTPAHKHFKGMLLEPADMSRTLFGAGTTRGRSTTGFGDLELANGAQDGEAGPFDHLCSESVDGRELIIRRGPAGGAYPSDFTTVLVATMSTAEFTQDIVRIKIRDRQEEMRVPLQPTKYEGSGLGTLEGDENLAAKPKPFCIGVARNVAPPCVETAKLIYQLHDDELDSVDAVYERGVPLLGYRTWDDQTGITGFGVTDHVMCAAYGDGIYVIAGTGGSMASSTDKTNWTSRTSGFSSDAVKGLAYSPTLDLFVAVGDAGKLTTSPDAETWTARTSQFTGAQSIESVIWVPEYEIFVAVGGSGGTQRVTTSADGITWTSKFTDAFGLFFDVAYGRGLLVAVGYHIAISADGGGTWQDASFPTEWNPNPAYAIAFGNGVFVAGGDESTLGLSADGVVWVPRASQFGATDDVNGLAYTDAVFIAVGAGGKVSTSRTGDDFELVASPGFGSAILLAVEMVNGEPLICATPRTIGFPSAPDSYASTSALLDDANEPAPGSYKVYAGAEGTFIRLGATPEGPITCDITEGATAADRKSAQCYKRLLERAGKVTGDWSASDITTLDAAAPYEIGFWTDQETDYALAFDRIAASVRASWFIDRLGVFRIKQLLAPSGTPVKEFTANQVSGLVRLTNNDPSRGIPAHKTIVRYARNHTLQPTDLSPAITAAHRQFVQKEWREAFAEDADVQTAHPLAVQQVDDSLLAIEADAQDEADRRQAIDGVQRGMFEFATPLTEDAEELELAEVIRVTHPRFGLDEGELLVVLGSAPDRSAERLLVTAWGAE